MTMISKATAAKSKGKGRVAAREGKATKSKLQERVISSADALLLASGVYYIPKPFYLGLNMQGSSGAQPIAATIVGYASSNGAPITLQMVSTWAGQAGQDPRKPQRLIVFNGILDATLPPILWEDTGTPLGRDRQWDAKPLTNKNGYLTVLPLHMEGGPAWTQNTYAGNPYLQTYGNFARTVYEDSNDEPGSTRPDIVATISAPNVAFTALTQSDFAKLLHRSA